VAAKTTCCNATVSASYMLRMVHVLPRPHSERYTTNVQRVSGGCRWRQRVTAVSTVAERKGTFLTYVRYDLVTVGVYRGGSRHAFRPAEEHAWGYYSNSTTYSVSLHLAKHSWVLCCNGCLSAGRSRIATIPVNLRMVLCDCLACSNLYF